MTTTSTSRRLHLVLALGALLTLVLAPAEAQDSPPTTDNTELKALFEADQGDRSGSMHDMDWDAVSKRDAERRKRVMEIMDAGAATTAADFYHSAMVFQHGMGVEDIRIARDWAKKATELADPESRLYRSAKWLSAAATDRHLHRQQKPQIYGTQYLRPSPDGPWTQEPYDRDAVTPEERAAHGVPPIAEQEKRLAAMNEELRRRGLLATESDDTPGHEG